MRILLSIGLVLLCCAGCEKSAAEGAPVTAAVPGPKNLIEVSSDAEFTTKSAQGLVLVDVGATWCGPCVKLGPELVALATSHPELTILRVDADKLAGLSDTLKANEFPTLMLYQDGKEVKRTLGYYSQAELATWIVPAAK